MTNGQIFFANKTVWFSSRTVGSGHEKKMDHKINLTMTQKRKDVHVPFEFLFFIQFLVYVFF